MKYDEDKLNAYWKKKERIWATLRNNGWKGPGTPRGRDIKYDCGHSVWAGYGLSLDNLKKCHQCEHIAKYGKDYD